MDSPVVQVYLNRSLYRNDSGRIETPDARPYQLEIRGGKLVFQSAWLCNSDEQAEANLERLTAILEQLVTVERVAASLDDPRKDKDPNAV